VKAFNKNHTLLLLSVVVGIGSSLAALLLKHLIAFIRAALTHPMTASGAHELLLIYPVGGLLLTHLFVKYIVRDDISHGITKVLYALSQRKSRIKPHNMWSSLVASSVTIGLGGSVGAESPIVLTGAAIGSNLGRLLRMEQKTLMLLIGCGAAGAIAGIFKAPIAGLVFVIEVLMLDFTLTAVMPLLISSVTAATLSYLFTGGEALFPFSQTDPFVMERIPFVFLLGVLCGLLSLYVTRVMNKMETALHKLSPLQKVVLCGGTLSLLLFLFPPLYGEGYETITALLNGQYAHLLDKNLPMGLLCFLLLLLLTKPFASCATTGAGGCGGVFAPSLYLGCILGFVFAHASNAFDFTPFLPEKNFSLLGMAGCLSGIMHAPLTGVFLIAELTGGYALFLPLMMVSIGSYLTILLFEPHSIYTLRLAQKGELLTHHKDKAVLTLLNSDNVIEKDFQIVTPDMTLGDVVKVIALSTRNVFPVIDKNGILLGVVLLDDIRNIMFRPELYDRFLVSKFMVAFPDKIIINTPMEKVMQTFDDTKAWNLPVVDENGHYVGFMSKSKIFNSYREILVDNFSGD